MIDWLKSNMVSCFFKSNFGIDCPGCGFQRSFIELLNGNFFGSISTYPPLLPLLFMYVLLLSHLFFRLKNGASILLVTFIINIVLIFSHFVYKIIL
jgi:membrane protein insertase Oxa1/YidC/SpoIIIJ